MYPIKDLRDDQTYVKHTGQTYVITPSAICSGPERTSSVGADTFPKLRTPAVNRRIYRALSNDRPLICRPGRRPTGGGRRRLSSLAAGRRGGRDLYYDEDLERRRGGAGPTLLRYNKFKGTITHRERSRALPPAPPAPVGAAGDYFINHFYGHFWRRLRHGVQQLHDTTAPPVRGPARLVRVTRAVAPSGGVPKPRLLAGRGGARRFDVTPASSGDRRPPVAGVQSDSFTRKRAAAHQTYHTVDFELRSLKILPKDRTFSGRVQ
ncbi:hypothetical protein EVAR_103973_1 [Eumeta japonica]|uniref:Uncharacterized protein n=1 Tax=Eumeta variegata TaxID=151549 RepID=A0A4C1XXZ8_EUMVA|nr:hypothetical protein EVAR_103973_1 [Eumeta japonica]